MKPSPLPWMEAVYIESGTFQGGEEDASNLGLEINNDDECAVMKKDDFEKFSTSHAALSEAIKTMPGWVAGEDSESYCKRLAEWHRAALALAEKP